MKKLRLTQSEREVILSLLNIHILPGKGRAGFGRYKRHMSAIEKLKTIGQIKKDGDNILQLTHPVNYYIELLAINTTI